MTREAKERVLVPLADGFEELEAVAVIDVLRRAGLEVVVAGLKPGVPVGRSRIGVRTDALLGELDLERFTAIVLPGGLAGARALAEDERVLALIRRLAQEGRVGAICAAPLALVEAGVVEGLPITAHPSVRGDLEGATVLAESRVVRSGRVITSQGPGTAVEFALALVEELAGRAAAAEIARAMCVPG
jgi:4-methyl-5(b-hydroxyethyl)-thiazole monophosphate biosynthesis